MKKDDLKKLALATAIIIIPGAGIVIGSIFLYKTLKKRKTKDG